jgi:hypothetical protein
VRRDLATAGRLLALPTVALLVVLAFVPGRLPIAVRLYALVACTVVLGLALAALRRGHPPVRRLRPPIRKPSPSARPTALARIEGETILGIANAFDLHRRLAPRVRRLALGLLATRRRVSLDESPEEAKSILGEETWELVRSDRPPPTDRVARGIPPDALTRVVESLERI